MERSQNQVILTFSVIRGMFLQLCESNVIFLCVSVCEVVQSLQLSSNRERSDVVGDLSVCLDGLQVDHETFASEEQKHSESLNSSLL